MYGFLENIENTTLFLLLSFFFRFIHGIASSLSQVLSKLNLIKIFKINNKEKYNINNMKIKYY
jgi:hypothetical protein